MFVILNICFIYKLKTIFNLGEMAEWLKAPAWKACILLKGIKGSNPFLSAKNNLNNLVKFF